MLNPRYQPRIIGHILKNKQKNKCVCIHGIIELVKMKIKIKMKKDHIELCNILQLINDTLKTYH